MENKEILEIAQGFEREVERASDKIHFLAVSKGFWPENRSIAECVALIHSEISEFLEAARKPIAKQDHHCPEFKNMEIELADAVIRIFDLSARLDLRIGPAIVAKHGFNITRPYKHGKNF